MKKIAFLIFLLLVYCSNDDSTNYGRGDNLEGSQQSDSASKIELDAKLNEQYNLGFQKAYYLNNNIIRKHLELTHDEFWRLVAEVYYNNIQSPSNFTINVVGDYFESIQFLPYKGYKKIYSFQENLLKSFSFNRSHEINCLNNFFIPTDTIRIPNSHNYLVTMYGYGFENTPYVFSIFNIEDGKYKFQGILDSSFSSSIGYQKIKNIIAHNNESNIIIGEGGGGDDDVFWNSLWLVIFNNDFKVNLLKRYYSINRDGKEQMKFNYSLNPDNKIIFVKTFKRSTKPDDSIYSDWIETKCDTIIFNDLIKKINKTI